MIHRTLAGLLFRVYSPSLYIADVDRGTCSLVFDGKEWVMVLLSLDEPQHTIPLGTFADVLDVLEEALVEAQQQ